MTTAVKNWTEWLKESRFAYMSEEQKEQTFRWLCNVRDKVLDRANIKPDDVLIDIGTGTGLLAFGAYEILKENGKVIASDSFEDCVEECKKIAEKSDTNENLEFLISDASKMTLPENSVDVAVMRSVLVHIVDKQPAINESYRILKPGGRISIYEPIVNSNTKYYELVNPENIPNYEKFKEAEIKIMSMPDDAITNFNDKTLYENFVKAGFKDIDVDVNTEQSTYVVSSAMVDPWFNTPPSPGNKTLKQRFMEYLSEDEINDYIEKIKADLDGKEITVKSFSAYISAVK